MPDDLDPSDEFQPLRQQAEELLLKQPAFKVRPFVELKKRNN